MLKQLKFTSKKGSAMVLVIIAMSLFLIISTIIMSQINNQIKSNSKLYNETQYKYKAEGIIEEKISTIYIEINDFIKKRQSEYNVNIEYGDYIKETIQENKVLTSQIIGNKNIVLEIDVIAYYDKKGNSIIKGKKLKSISTENLKGLNLEGVFENKYKVNNIIDFNISNDFKLIYEVKSYSKGPIK